MFLKDGNYIIQPIRQTTKKTLRRLACHFFSSSVTFYKRLHDGVLLRGMDALKVNRIMSEIHGGKCGLHMFAKEILSQGYYWSPTKTDCFKHVRKCHLYQIYANKINQSPASLDTMTSPWHFQCAVLMHWHNRKHLTDIDLFLWPLIILPSG